MEVNRTKAFLSARLPCIDTWPCSLESSQKFDQAQVTLKLRGEKIGAQNYFSHFFPFQTLRRSQQFRRYDLRGSKHFFYSSLTQRWNKLERLAIVFFFLQIFVGTPILRVCYHKALHYIRTYCISCKYETSPINFKCANSLAYLDPSK